MGEKEIYRVGIVGLGRTGSLFEEDPKMDKPCSHAGAYTAFSKTEIVAACDIRQDRLDRFYNTWNSKQKNKINMYRDYKEMFEKEKLDIVSVCTQTPEHPEITIAAANSKPYTGISAIFCEKPIAPNLRFAEDMIDACKKNDIILSIDHTRRWDRDTETAKRILDSGKIGEIRAIDAYTTAGLFNGASHLFDMMRFLIGDAESVYGKLSLDKTRDPSGTGMMKFKNGAQAFLHCDFYKYVLFEYKITGNKGRLAQRSMIRGEKALLLELAKPSKKQTGQFELYAAEPKELEEFEEKGEKVMPLVKAIREITDIIEGKSNKPTCSGEDGRAAIELALAFHESDRTGKEIRLPLENKYLTVIPRETSFTEDGKLVEAVYQK